MKDLMKDKKIVIVDIETSGLCCGENGKEPARILRVDATKVENGKVGESFSSLVACGEYIPKRIKVLTGISNKTLKGAPRLKTVLKQLKGFTNGYEVYARNSEFVNKFLTYYGNKNGIQIDLAKEKDYNEISKFISKRELREYLKNSKDNETIALAKLLVKES
jgi:DNA polymerase III alpha subunit (gram-positive type)